MAGKYLERVAEAVASSGIKPGSLYYVEVKHDDWCPLLHGEQECTCDPDVTISPDQLNDPRQ